MTIATQRPILTRAELEAFDPRPAQRGEELRFCCPLPACADKPRDRSHQSLAVNTQTGLWRCHRCEANGQLREHWPPLQRNNGHASRPDAKVQLQRVVYPARLAKHPQDRIEHVRLDYTDGTKRMWWQRNGESGLGGLLVESFPLWGAEILKNLPPDLWVVVAEGEKARDALFRAGIPAVGTVTGASGTPDVDVLKVLAGREVILWPDHDDVGYQHMNRIAERLKGVARAVRWFAWEDAPAKGADAADYLKQLPDARALRAALTAAPVWTPAISSFSSYNSLGDNFSETATTVPSVPAFPLHVLPAVARRLVEEGASAMGVPPDMIAVPLLAFAGAAIGNTQRIRLKEGYEQSPTLYAAVVAPPGSAKSPAAALAQYPLTQLQRTAYDRFKRELETYEHRLADWTAADKSARGTKPERPVLEHFFSTDSTMEASYTMLAESAGFALFRDELVSWVASFDAYRGGKGGDRQNWLSLWAGSAVKVDRKNADPIVITDPVIAVVGGIQPDMLEELADEAGRRDGFIERILWCYPDVRPTGWSEETVTIETKDAVTNLFQRLRASRPAEHPVLIDPTARGIWATWYDGNAEMTAQAVGLAQGVYAKMPNQAARLALILHCLEHPEHPSDEMVSAETMNAAIDLAEYFRSHAHRALTHFGVAAVAPNGGLAHRVLRVLELAEGEVSKDDLYEGLGRKVAASELDRALKELESWGLAERRSNKGEGRGRPRELWRRSSEKYEEYEENPDGQPP